MSIQKLTTCTGLLEELAKKQQSTISFYQVDLTDSKALSETFATFAPLVKRPIRGLVACAGVSDNDPAVDFSIDRFRRVMEINVLGTFAIAKAVAMEMKKNNVDGSMVLVASMSGTVVNKVG